MDHGRQARKTKQRRKAAKQRRRARRQGAPAPVHAIAPVAPVPPPILPLLPQDAPAEVSRKPPGWWERRLVRPVLGLVSRLLHPEPAPRRLAPQQELPCDLFLAVGHGAVHLFARGPLDELTFFQRTSRSVRHDLEFVTRREAGAAAEEYAGFALLRLTGEAEPLPTWASLEARWDALRDAHGLLALPRPASADGGGFIDGRNRAVAGKRAQVDCVRRRISHAETLALLRTELSPTERVAWVERAFTAPPSPGLVVHRYYLSGARGDLRNDIWLVRHTAGGKRLLRGEPSRHGLQVLAGERRQAA